MRCIIISAYTGTVWHDTADLSGKTVTIDEGTLPSEIARICDASIGVTDHVYTDMDAPNLEPTGYLVYRADDIVGCFSDAMDKEFVQAVQRDCKLLGYVDVARAEEVAEAA